MESNIEKTEATFVRTILSVKINGWQRSRIHVPKYQRPFSWDSKNKAKHVDQLFDDFIEHNKATKEAVANAENVHAYYLGALVFVHSFQNSSPRIDILDGQQRLTTLYLFCAALIRNLQVLLDSIKESNIDNVQKALFKQEIHNKIDILKVHLKNENNDTILKMGYNDDIKHFEYCVDTYGNNPLSNDLKKSHPILKAFYLLDEKILELLQESSANANNEQDMFTDNKATLYMLSDYMTGESCEISYTTIRKGQEFTIFQTLNNRGKELNIYDLTRNIMIQVEDKGGFNLSTESKFDSEIRSNTNPNGNFNQKNAENIILNNWNMQFPNKITSSKYMLAFDNFQKKKASDGGFKSGPTARQNFTEFLDTLLKSSYAFSEIKDPISIRRLDDSFGSATNRLNLSNQLILLNITNVKQFYALYFALRYCGHTCDIIMNYISLVEKTYVNLLLLAEQSPAKLESVFSAFAYEIYSGEVEIIELYRKHKEQIQSLVNETSIDFLQVFNKKEVSNTQSKYLLARIQKELSGNSIQMENVHLEHILPNKYQDTWSDIIFLDSKKISEIDSETVDGYLSRIGNHTLLVDLTNIPLSNALYETKIIEYKKEQIAITKGSSEKSVTYFNKWNADSIEKRQKALGIVAKEIWGI